MELLGEPVTVFSDYKKISLYIPTIKCSFKCVEDAFKEGHVVHCQNYDIYNKKEFLNLSNEEIIKKYIDSNPLIESIIFSGMDPIDDFDDVYDLIVDIRKKYFMDIVIYTGYYKEEIQDKVDILNKIKNIVMKFGRFKPYLNSKYDRLGGVKLISENQYFERIS